MGSENLPFSLEIPKESWKYLKEFEKFKSKKLKIKTPHWLGVLLVSGNSAIETINKSKDIKSFIPELKKVLKKAYDQNDDQKLIESILEELKNLKG